MKMPTLVGIQLAAVIAAAALMLASFVSRTHSDVLIGTGSVIALLALTAFDYRAGWKRSLGGK